jgi:hypothetical protein
LTNREHEDARAHLCNDHEALDAVRTRALVRIETVKDTVRNISTERNNAGNKKQFQASGSEQICACVTVACMDTALYASAKKEKWKEVRKNSEVLRKTHLQPGTKVITSTRRVASSGVGTTTSVIAARLAPTCR